MQADSPHLNEILGYEIAGVKAGIEKAGTAEMALEDRSGKTVSLTGSGVWSLLFDENSR